ncbi:MAG: hypothetical protein HW421_2324 [Ignavibacteria bacterium]|nr:hypothetical protein [Ignavibacteria bacterium]
MIIEREIPESWISDAINAPDYTEFISNEELHYIKQIKEFGNRYLRVVVNPYTQPKRIITLFFDRRIKGKI